MRIWLGIMMLLAAASAFAARPAEYMRQAEASMLATGRIEIDTEGKVTRFSLDKEKELPPEVVKLVGRAAPLWRFKPVLRDGRPIRAATDMSLRLVATKLEDGGYEVGIRSAYFAEKPKASGENDMRPPVYPMKALEAGISGTVHLLVKVGHDGRVLDAMAEQVNLSTVTGARSMERWRRVLAEASLARAREWRMAQTPEAGTGTGGFELFRVPVRFALSRNEGAYGRWEVYVPGPRQQNPWDQDSEGIAFTPDALLPGLAYRAGEGWQLLTTLSGA